MEFTNESLEPFGETFLDMSVPTQLSFKTPLVFRMVKELVSHECLPWTGSHRAELCFEEALTNSMLHGNKLDAAKKVHVTLFGDAERWGAIVEDEGEGFDKDALPDPQAPEFLMEETGRGIMLMDGYLDELRYNRSENRLLMARHRQTEPEEAEAMAAVEGEETPLGEEGPVSVTEQEGVQVLEVLAQRVSDDNVAAVRDGLNAGVVPGRGIVIDFSRMAYISSVGLGAVVSIYKRIRSEKGHLIFASLQPAVEEILESAHLLRLFQVAPDRHAAVKELKKIG